MWVQTLCDGFCVHLGKVFGSSAEAAVPQSPPCRAELNLFRILVSRHFRGDMDVGDILEPFTETGIFW